MPPSDSPVGQASGPLDRLASNLPRKLQSEALQALLVDLGSQIQRGTSREAADAASSARFHPTGFAELDACLARSARNSILCTILYTVIGALLQDTTVVFVAFLVG